MRRLLPLYLLLVACAAQKTPAADLAKPTAVDLAKPTAVDLAKPAEQQCGGLAARPCPTGKVCVDDPTDSCDPAKGGRDCSGICRDATP